MLRVLFAAIRAGAPHGDIRVLKNLFLHDRARYEQLLAEVDGIESEWEGSGSESLADPDIVDLSAAADEDEDEDELDEPPGPNVPNYPRTDIRDAIDNAIDGFEASMTEDVAKTLRQVLNRLQVLSDTGGKLDQALAGEHAAQVRDALGEIVAWADLHRDLLA